MLDALPWKDFITLGAAILGASLGIMNTWNALNQRRVRLRVTPAYAVPEHGGEIGITIEVVNISVFPVTIAEIGFCISEGKRILARQPGIIDGERWPRRLESRAAVSAYFDPRDLATSFKAIRKAYARTACGEFRYGNSPALRQLRQIMR